MRLADEIVINGKRATVRSYAKINLTLDVLGKRDDGYHTIETIMQLVNLSDIVIVDKTNDYISVSSNKKFLPTNEKNIAYKATQLFYDTLGITGGARVFIHKNIPVAAGLAGGSGNGAAVLVALNHLHSKPFSDEELLAIGSKLGADIPYCMTGGTQIATGIGEIMEKAPSMSKHYVLLVTPPIAVSTPWVYTEFDNTEKKTFPDTKKMLQALENDDYYAICNTLSNTLEDVTIKEHPVIKGIKEKMILNGADGALMSGSGPTVFGFFSDFKKAKASQDSFALMYRDVYLTTTL